ncbi:MAG: type II toxin-antitoxin system RelE family toxin [Desulfococcaceae bacterium]
MKVRYESSFSKDLKKIQDPKTLLRIRRLIETIKSAESPLEISNLKKIRGQEGFFRVRLSDYRVGLDIAGDEVIFVRVLHRKDIYRFFPPK